MESNNSPEQSSLSSHTLVDRAWITHFQFPSTLQNRWHRNRTESILNVQIHFTANIVLMCAAITAVVAHPCGWKVGQLPINTYVGFSKIKHTNVVFCSSINCTTGVYPFYQCESLKSGLLISFSAALNM